MPLLPTDALALQDARVRLRRATFDIGRIKVDTPTADVLARAQEYALARQAYITACHVVAEAVGLPPEPVALGDIQGLQAALDAKADLADVAAAPVLRQVEIGRNWPEGGVPTTLTPTAHGSTVVRVFPFELPGDITPAAILIRSNAALANCLRVAIFNEDGTQRWAAGPLSTVAGRIAITTGLPGKLDAGLYYWATTNNNVSSTTAAYSVTPALAGTANLPRWGTVPTAGGAMPASIAPAAITETTGGWMAYVTFSEWST